MTVISSAHHRRIAVGILSLKQDMDFEASPFQVNQDYQVPRKKTMNYIGAEELERQRSVIETATFLLK